MKNWTRLLPIVFMIIFSGVVMVRSYNGSIGNTENWRLVFATIGFIIFSALGLFFVRSILAKK